MDQSTHDVRRANWFNNLYQKNLPEIRSCEKENCIETETLNYDKR